VYVLTMIININEIMKIIIMVIMKWKCNINDSNINENMCNNNENEENDK